jgi:hypothetical protein
MKMEIVTYKIAEFLELFRNGMLRANPEYQRGEVWGKTHKRKLIDSVLRGYPIPLIFLHHIKKSVAGMQREDLEIIDGQQRINALYEFAEGAYKLFDPVNEADEAKFPDFIKRLPCPWGNKHFSELESDLQLRFLATPLAVATVTTDIENEARDLFIRLQSGLPLNGQETRDAWPGNFTDFILRIGGKPQLARYPGHGFFKRVLKMKPDVDRGKTRQLAAQIALLFFVRRSRGGDAFTDINSRAIDTLYYTELDFDANRPEVKRFISILDWLEAAFAGAKRPKMRAHEAMHLVLLVDSLWEDYDRGWQDKLVDAHDEFAENLVRAARTKDHQNPDEYWTQYGQWTRVNSDRADRIRHRHMFYVDKMMLAMGPLRLRDPKRSFGPLERELIYYRDKKRCAVCNAVVPWDDAEIHHVDPHANGGPTTVSNGVLVHQLCHPRGAAAAEFRERVTE